MEKGRASRMKRTFFSILYLCMVLLFAGCREQTEPASIPVSSDSEETSPFRIAVYTDVPEDIYWQRVLQGIRTREESLQTEKTEVFYVDSMEEAEQQQADVLLAYVRQTVEAPEGMQVIWIEPADTKDILYVRADYLGAGNWAAESIARDLSARAIQTGKLLIVASQEKQSVTQAALGFSSAVRAAGRFRIADDFLICVQEKEIAALLENREEEEIVGIFAVDLEAAGLLAQYIRDNGLEDGLSVIVLGGNSEILKAIRMGTLYGAVLNDAAETGTQALDLAEDMAAGSTEYESRKTACVLIDRDTIDDPALRGIEQAYIPDGEE